MISARPLKTLMFVFDNLKDVDDRGIQALLREVSSDNLILALKGSDEELKGKSSRTCPNVRQNCCVMIWRPKGLSRCQKLKRHKKEILTIARRMADAGEISLGGSGEAMLWKVKALSMEWQTYAPIINPLDVPPEKLTAL